MHQWPMAGAGWGLAGGRRRLTGADGGLMGLTGTWLSWYSGTYPRSGGEATAEGRVPRSHPSHTHSHPTQLARNQFLASHPFSHTLVHQTCSPSLHCMACPKQPVLEAPGTLRLHSDTNHTKYHTRDVCTMHHAPCATLSRRPFQNPLRPGYW